jgi:phage terminase large subunit-like protein
VAVRWIERTLVHGEGDFESRPFLLEPWQKKIIYRIYEYDPATLERIVRRVLLVMPKGNGKTPLVSGICDFELAGPCIPTPDGRGGLRPSPNIPVAAASYEQADRLFGTAKAAALGGPLAAHLEPFDTEILLRGRMGRLYRVPAVAGTNDGGVPTTFAADEIHEWDGRKARVHLVIGNGMVKRANVLELNLSTPDAADPESLFGTLHAAAMRVITGEVADPSFLAVWYTADDSYEIVAPGAEEYDPDRHPAILREAIAAANPGSWMDIERIARRLEVDRVPLHEFERYHLARLRRPEGQWLPPGAWEQRADPDRPPPPESAEVVLFFDGSYNGDSTALMGATVEPRPHLFVVGCWERPPDDQHWLVPREAVKARVKWAFRHWRVVRMGWDPPGWHAEGEQWEETYGDDVVLRHETNKRAQTSADCSRFYSAVVNDGLTQDGDPRLARHLRNAVVKETPDGAYITKDGRHGPKIDLAVAAVGALAMAALPPDGPISLEGALMA